MFERSKALIELKKIQAALAKEVIEVEAGNGAVIVRMNGEQKPLLLRLSISLSKLPPKRCELFPALSASLGYKPTFTARITSSFAPSTPYRMSIYASVWYSRSPRTPSL
jgi:hypothetical protein